MTLTVIIPIYNEEKTVAKLIDKVLKQSVVSQILLIDDGSTDNSAKLIKKIKSKKIKYIHHKKNQGKGKSIIAGIKNADSELIIIQDADLELDPKEYKKLIKPIITQNIDMVIGNRWAKKLQLTPTTLANFAFTLTTLLLFQKPIMDPYCCYKVMSKKLWKKLNLKSNGFEIEAEIVAKVCMNKYKIKQISVNYKPRKFKDGKKIRAKDALTGIMAFIGFRFNL